MTLLANAAEEPVFSPDGSRIAFISYRNRNVTYEGGLPVLAGELYVKVLGGSPIRLTHTIDRQESSPNWDPSGERLAYTQAIRPGADAIKQINADGTCRQVLIGETPGVALYEPAWQPGAGREAGRIAC